jgi:HAD superfamily hydrolase (TIGR01509 family)
MLRAILFDLFETLVTESATQPPGVASQAPELGCERDAFRREWKARRPSVVAGQLSFRRALEDCATTLGRRADEATLVRLCDRRARIKAEPFARLEQPVLTMIDALRARGLRLGVISNCCAEDVVAWPGSALSSRVDCTVLSFEVGLAKPDPEIYLEAVRRLGVGTSETWFIGDGGSDELSGAEQAGLRALKALWFLRRWPLYRDAPSSFPSIARIEDVVGLVERASGLPA